MATIEFDNGTKVQFDGNPTPADIEEVATKLGIKSSQAPEQKQSPGVFKDLSTGVAKGELSTLRNITKVSSTIASLPGRAINAVAGTHIPDVPELGGGALTDKVLAPKNTGEEVGKFAEQTGEFFVPGAFVTKGAKVAIAEQHIPDVLKFLGTAGVEAADAGAVTAAQGGSGSDIAKNAATAGAFSTAQQGFGALARTPVGKNVINYLSEKLPAERINKILRPRDADFNFGKNPGLGVVQEPGVLGVAKGPLTRGQLLTRIGEAKQKVGQKIEALVSTPTEKYDVTEELLKPIAEAKKLALESGEKSLFNRFKEIEDGLTKTFAEEGGDVVANGDKNLVLNAKEIQKLKIQIGKATRWTGQAFDNDVNKVRVSIYRNLDRHLDDTVPGIESLNKRYANLLTAEKSLERRNKQLQRLVSVGLRQSGVIGTVGLGATLTGSSPVEALAKGVAGGLAFGALSSTAAQTRLAKAFTALKPQEQEKIFGLLPTLKNILLESRTTNSKAEQSAND